MPTIMNTYPLFVNGDSVVNNHDIIGCMKSIIVAYDKNYGIGANNDLLWMGKLPADLKHFKNTTTGHSIIMGYNTYRSIGKPLPNRRNIVISDYPMQVEGFEVVSSLDEAYALTNDEPETFVIGGGVIFAQAISQVDRVYATKVDALFDNATVFFPKIDLNLWREINREKHQIDENNLYNYDFVVYEKLSINR